MAVSALFGTAGFPIALLILLFALVKLKHIVK